MENSFSTADVSEIKKQITELYDSSKKSIEKHEKQIITGINLIKKEQTTFYTKLLDLLSKNDPNSNENTDMSPSTKNNSIIFGKLSDTKTSSKKPKSKTPIKRNNNKHLTFSNNKSDFSNKQPYLKSFYKNSSYNKVCSPSIKIANIIKKSLKEKMNSNNVNTNGTSKVKCIKKKLFNKKYHNLNRSNTNSSNTQLHNNHKKSNNSNSNKISFNKLSKTILHRNVQSTELISVNDNDNSFISNKECILLKDESISKEITPLHNQHPFQTELRKLSIIDIPFSINPNYNGSPSPNDYNTNINNDTIIDIINILINSEILPLKEKIILSTLTKSIHAIHTPLKIISNHMTFLNKCISCLKYELEMLMFIPSRTAQITLQFMSYDDENCIYNNISFAKAIYYLICNDEDISLSSKDDIVKEIYNIKHKEKLSNMLLSNEVICNIKEMDCLKCKRFIEVIDSFYNWNNNVIGDKNNFNGIIKVNVYNKIMFYINEVYLYIKERHEMLSKKQEHMENMKKCQQIEIVFKLKQ